MQLFDVFYFGCAMDSDVPLPAPSPDIRCVRNTSWDHHEMAPEYDQAAHDTILARAKREYGVAPYSPKWDHVGEGEGKVSPYDFAAWRKIIAHHLDFYTEIDNSACALIWVALGRPAMLRWPA